MVNVLIVNVLFYILFRIWQFTGLPTFYKNANALSVIVLDGILLHGKINPPLWVIKDLFLGYIICMFIAYYYKNSKYKYVVAIAASFVYFFAKQPWMFCIVLGLVLNLLYHDDNPYIVKFNKIQRHKTAIGIKFLLSYLCFIQKEEEYLFFIYSFGAFFLLGAIRDSKIINRLFSHKLLVLLGDTSFEFYMLHIWVLYFFIPVIKIMLPTASLSIIFMLYLCVLTFAVLLYQKCLSNNINRVIGKVLTQ